jgi:septal ring factor EnvC (AmiA/AmiB activator)
VRQSKAALDNLAAEHQTTRQSLDQELVAKRQELASVQAQVNETTAKHENLLKAHAELKAKLL